MQMPPLSYRAAEMASRRSYEARRFLPTVAGMLQITPREEASIGNWKDLVKTPTFQQASAFARSMSVLYDEGKAQLQAVTKVAVVMALQKAASNAKSYNVSFDALRTYLPDMQVVRENAKSAGCGLIVEPLTRTQAGRKLDFSFGIKNW